MRNISRIAAFTLLAVLTAYGLFEFARGDWEGTVAYWRDHAGVLPGVLALAVLDVAFEALAALWVYARFGVRAFDRWGAATPGRVCRRRRPPSPWTCSRWRL